MRNFRGKTKGGKWVYGYVFYLDRKYYIIHQNAILQSRDSNFELVLTEPHNFIEVIPSSVGQSTGFFDKNNDEIYAGHKIDVHPDGKREFIRTVVWDDKFAQFRALFPDGSGQLFTKRQCLTYEICGDIHTPLEKEE